MRHDLFMADSAAVCYDPDLQTLYDCKRADGKHQFVFIGAVYCKLCIINPYDPDEESSFH